MKNFGEEPETFIGRIGIMFFGQNKYG